MSSGKMSRPRLATFTIRESSCLCPTYSKETSSMRTSRLVLQAFSVSLKLMEYHDQHQEDVLNSSALSRQHLDVF